MNRIGILKIEEVLPHVVFGQKPPHGDPSKHNRPEKEFLGQLIYMDSFRYQTFIKSGTVCVECGLEASYFAVEKNDKSTRYHLNLYGLKNLREVLFTKDHIIPRSRGGGHDVNNLQTMCSPCNNKKGNGSETGNGSNCDNKFSYSKQRINRLRFRINQKIAQLKELAKKVRIDSVPSVDDGGPEFRKVQTRRRLLVNRAKRLDILLKRIRWAPSNAEISTEQG